MLQITKYSLSLSMMVTDDVDGIPICTPGGTVNSTRKVSLVSTNESSIIGIVAHTLVADGRKMFNPVRL